MPVTIRLVTEENRRQAILVVEKAAPGTRVTFSDPGATEAQLKLLGILLDDIISQSYRAVPTSTAEWERILSAACFCDQVLPDYEDNKIVVRGVKFEELSVEEASNQIEFLYSFGARNGINFREKKKP
jgi:NinB protein